MKTKKALKIILAVTLIIILGVLVKSNVTAVKTEPDYSVWVSLLPF